MISITLFTSYERVSKLRKRLLASYSKGIVLDVGASQSPNEFLDHSERVKEVWALDIEPPKGRLPNKYRRFIAFDLNKLDYGLPIHTCSIDTVILGEVLEHLDTPIDVLEECKRILKPHGLLLISTPTPKYYLERIHIKAFGRPMGFPEHKILFERKVMTHILNRLGFTVRQIVGYSFWVPMIKVGIMQVKYALPETLTWHQIYICVRG